MTQLGDQYVEHLETAASMRASMRDELRGARAEIKRLRAALLPFKIASDRLDQHSEETGISRDQYTHDMEVDPIIFGDYVVCEPRENRDSMTLCGKRTYGIISGGRSA